MAPSRAPRPITSICASCVRAYPRHPRRAYTTTPILRASEDSLPRVAHPSFWSSLVPKPLRRDPSNTTPPGRSRFLTHPRNWNPYTIFIILALVAGSNAIQILALRNETLSYTRKTEAKLSVLREVVDKVKRGEDVDVRKALGTGREESEAEWESMAKELEEANVVRARTRRTEEEAGAEAREGAASTGGVKEGSDGGGNDVEEKTEQRRPKFLM